MTSMESRAAVASPTRPWPADRVELWPIEKLIPYANNPRLHSAADVERIAASILKWGWSLGRGHYHWRHETCWYAVREGKAGHWQGGRKQSTVWEIANNNPFGNRQREQSPWSAPCHT